MNLKVYYNLLKTQQRLTPRSHFKRALWNQLDAKWDQTYSVVVPWYHLTWVRNVGGVVAGFVGVASLATSVYAYNSPSVSVGSTLFPIKLGLENLVEITKRTPRDKAKFLLTKIQRREDERQARESEDRQNQGSGSEVQNSPTTSDQGNQPDQGNQDDSQVQQIDDQLKQTTDRLMQVKHDLDGGNQDVELRSTIDQKVQQVQTELEKHRGRGRDSNQNSIIILPTTPTSTTGVSASNSINRGDNGDGNDRGNGLRNHLRNNNRPPQGDQNDQPRNHRKDNKGNRSNGELDLNIRSTPTFTTRTPLNLFGSQFSTPTVNHGETVLPVTPSSGSDQTSGDTFRTSTPDGHSGDTRDGGGSQHRD